MMNFFVFVLMTGHMLGKARCMTGERMFFDQEMRFPRCQNGGQHCYSVLLEPRSSLISRVVMYVHAPLRTRRHTMNQAPAPAPVLAALLAALLGAAAVNAANPTPQVCIFSLESSNKFVFLPIAGPLRGCATKLGGHHCVLPAPLPRCPPMGGHVL